MMLPGEHLPMVCFDALEACAASLLNDLSNDTETVLVTKEMARNAAFILAFSAEGKDAVVG